MTTLLTKHQRFAALRPLSPESVASLAAARDVRMVHESNAIEGNSLTLRETELLLSRGVTVSGNGRTARLAMNFVFLSAGYPPISIPTDLRQAYYNALEPSSPEN